MYASKSTSMARLTARLNVLEALQSASPDLAFIANGESLMNRDQVSLLLNVSNRHRGGADGDRDPDFVPVRANSWPVTFSTCGIP